MRELNIMEIEHVSGAGLFDRIGAAFLGGMMGIAIGTNKGGVSGGSVGGILGVGAISGLVTMVMGGVFGVVQGATYGFVNGWNKTLEMFNKTSEQWLDQTVPTPKI